MASRPLILAAGALAALGIAAASHAALSPAFMAGLEAQAAAVTEGAVTVDFRTRNGSYSRHPELSGARDLHPDERRRLALAVSALPGVGGPYWRREERRQITQAAAEDPLFCERRIDAILKTRTIRFAEASARLDPTSAALLDEVADALKPCIGSRIAIIGHTNDSGDAAVNLALSERRADRVRLALARRGIPAVEFVVEGKGSEEPVEGLDPTDPANRRIEFELLQKAPLVPTAVDTPGAG
ncbi:MAG: OmpA family protein [Sphingomonadales bacterium CG12_big_fil_rev_8_21_14_0_65_65_10]|uniref:OmpA family protein n=1 Tax=Blastomonas marina TaxID=1867408 RepID=UPI000CA930A2|nr:OmpA family protein [Blastomonas marina]PIW55013.1 MAG: OmpA family protein [Sphingomonadales bacterium CG12_big_fil_rev_8_21_14_0_65_65_10]WPZ04000.1 OmpA family protein [Blastomonas marina]